jgi:riboflavin-specific deaminase-like protein
MVTAEGRLPDAGRAWALLLALARRAGEGHPLAGDVGLALDAHGLLEENGQEPWILARPSLRRGWAPSAGRSAIAAGPEAEMLLDLYMPMCVGEAAGRLVIGHLAQSLDGRIATVSGKSQWITSSENLVHAHRLRALCDVLLVGRRTVLEDNPQLTTRLVAGPSPVRAVVDPERCLAPDHRIFQDGVRPTLLFCSTDAARGATHHGRAEVIAIEPVLGELPVPAILAELHRRGLRRVFVEGGGVTISRFVQAGALARLQITVAPIVLGSGRSTVTLPEIQDLTQALELECRHFAMGRDLLFDCVFAPPADRRG